MATKFKSFVNSTYLIALIACTHFCTAQTITKKESVQSLYVEMYRDSIKLGSATGFVIKSKTKNYLVTNFHVLTNRNPQTGQWLNANTPVSPNRIAIAHHAKELGKNVVKWERLNDRNNKPLWLSNVIGREMVDVVELPLTDTVDIKIYDVKYNVPLTSKVLLQPTDRVFILGYPLGLRSTPILPIWKSGLIASEPDINQEGKPIMWVDAITYGGMSGSPVYFISQTLNTKDGGSSQAIGGAYSIFMGVFSHSQPNNVFGSLWKVDYLVPIFDRLP